jgi:chromate reductase
MSKPQVAVIVGSNRRDSINRKLAGALVKLAEGKLAFHFVQIDDLPIYNGDLEGSRPASVDRFTAEVARAAAILVVTPEHNRSLPALLKNAIDWGSKPADKNVWRDKPTAITGASPGASGTVSAQQHLRVILGNLGGLVLGGEVYISAKPELIDPAGQITVEATRVFLQAFMDRFATLVGRFA